VLGVVEMPQKWLLWQKRFRRDATDIMIEENTSSRNIVDAFSESGFIMYSLLDIKSTGKIGANTAKISRVSRIEETLASKTIAVTSKTKAGGITLDMVRKKTFEKLVKKL